MMEQMQASIELLERKFEEFDSVPEEQRLKAAREIGRNMNFIRCSILHPALLQDIIVKRIRCLLIKTADVFTDIDKARSEKFRKDEAALKEAFSNPPKAGHVSAVMRSMESPPGFPTHAIRSRSAADLKIFRGEQ